jgi:phage terminase small subunit
VSREFAGKLTPQQEQFCAEYLIDLNATQAAIRSDYSPRSATATSSKLMAMPKIQARLQELSQDRTRRTQVDADYVLNRLVEIDQLDVAEILEDSGEIKPIKQWPRHWRTLISGMDVAEMFDGRGKDKEHIGNMIKIKWPDKIKNLELLGQHVDVAAFKKDININITNTLADRMQSARARQREAIDGEYSPVQPDE